MLKVLKEPKIAKQNFDKGKKCPRLKAFLSKIAIIHSGAVTKTMRDW